MKKILTAFVLLGSISVYADCLKYNNHDICAGTIELYENNKALLKDITVDGFTVKANKTAQKLICNAFGYSHASKKGTFMSTNNRYNVKTNFITQAYPYKIEQLSSIICKNK